MASPAYITPWWQHHYTQCSDSTPTDAGCQYQRVVLDQCRVELNKEGVPVRRCERLLKRFRDCPGRAREELESTREEVVTELPPGAALDQHASAAVQRFSSLSEAVGQEDALDANLGQAFEEFLGWSREFASAGRLPLSPRRSATWRRRSMAEAQQEQELQQESRQRQGGFMGRLFKRGEDAGAQDARERIFEEYAGDFQEV